jgi:lipid II:glycine glycyltransferase (peptidoglycan interpeptide bridge formation enzyme)
MSDAGREEWERFISGRPEAHILQTAAWGDLKSAFDWSVERVIHGATGAQILFRRLPLGFTVAYIAKGPAGPDWAGLWPEVDRVCRRRRAVFLKVEPDAWEEEEAGFAAQMAGFRPGGSPVQPRRTVVVDLSGGEDGWLGAMKQKTRYNIRLAARKGVGVNPSSDLSTFHQLMRVTGERDGFGVHTLEYYRRAYDLFHPRGEAVILQAEFEGRPLGALMVFARGKRAWYLYGASNDEERSRMPTYLLQWEAMRWARAHGCAEYDLWGVPDEAEDSLEAQFETRHDGLWGVYRFKRGFGGRVRRSARTWERVYIPALYRLISWYASRRREG